MTHATTYTARRAVPRPAPPSAQAGACFSPADTLDESANTPPPAPLPVDEQAAAPISPGRSVARVGSGPASAGDRPGGPTPGDWVVFQGNVYHANHRHAPFTTASGEVIEDFHTGLIALVYGTRQAGDVPAGSFEGNAQLLAAAPELLALAEEYERNIEWTGAPDEFCLRLRATITKAKGGPHEH